MTDRYYTVFIYGKRSAAVNFRLPITSHTGFSSKYKAHAVILYNPVINMIMAANNILADYLVVSDCDGTLLKASVGVPPVNTEAIEAFTAAGGIFTVATGRTLPAVQRYSHQMSPFSAPVILCGGALIYDFNTDTAVLERCLPRDCATVAILQLINAFPGIGVDIAAEKKIFVVI